MIAHCYYLTFDFMKPKFHKRTKNLAEYKIVSKKILKFPDQAVADLLGNLLV